MVASRLSKRLAGLKRKAPLLHSYYYYYHRRHTTTPLTHHSHTPLPPTDSSTPRSPYLLQYLIHSPPPAFQPTAHHRPPPPPQLGLGSWNSRRSQIVLLNASRLLFNNSTTSTLSIYLKTPINKQLRSSLLSPDIPIQSSIAPLCRPYLPPRPWLSTRHSTP